MKNLFETVWYLFKAEVGMLQAGRAKLQYVLNPTIS